MSATFLITCLTDLRGATPTTEELGHETYLPQVKQFHEIAKAFATLTEGKYIKNTGDGDIVTFTSPDRAVQFASLLQSYYRDQSALNRIAMPIRIGLFVGTVREVDGDIAGSGANQAARLEALAVPGQIVINETMFNSLKTIFGPERAQRYTASLGKKSLKGIAEPPEQNLYSFDWSQYSTENPETSLVKLVSDHLKTAAVEISNLNLAELAHPGVIIWPAVPRKIATAIHRGQIEIIKLLALLGWRVILLIEDCSADEEYPKEYSDAFREKLDIYLRKRGVTLERIELLSEYYKPTHPDYKTIQSLFRTVTSKVNVTTLENINNKDYDQDQRDRIKKGATLNFLRPALSLAAVIHLAEQMDRKVIVVSGADEKMQWKCSYGIGNAREKIGVIMNPILLNKLDPNFQAFQKDHWPIWQSESELAEEMTTAVPNNLAWWVFCLHAFLPAFPSATVEISGTPLEPNNWTDPEQIPASVQPSQLARHVWPLLEA
jgi:class 3 adenylate cyclase